MAVTLTTTGFSIDGEEVPVYSGAVHYWRLERALWPTILDQVQALGFSMIETYIPWSVHEIAPGKYDWGQVDERKDFEAFLRLCEERKIWLLARPGPLINAELTNFGFPEWVLRNPQVQARTAVDSPHLDAAWGLHPPLPFPVPSYASEAFYTEVATWFDAVCPLIVRHLAPRGCIVSVQSDNETCYLFHEQPYATDYSADSLKLYRSFLKERYGGDLGALSLAYNQHYTDFAEVEPPRDFSLGGREDLPLHLDWIMYKEYQIRWGVARIARMLRVRGIEHVPIFHDVSFQHRTPLDLARMEAEPDIDWVGMNLYRNKESYRSTIQTMRFLAGTTRLPFVPEFGCGIWSHHKCTPTAEEEEFITLSSYMHGVKAVNFYMLVERERWQGSPITRHGTLRPDYARVYRRLSAFLQRYQFWQCERRPQALVVINYDLGRYEAMASTLHYAHADLYGLPAELFHIDLDLDLRWEALAEANDRSWDNWMGTSIAALQRHFIDYDLSDSHVSLEHLRRYPLVCLPTVDFMDAEDQRRLLAYVEEGGHLLLGPGMPYLDPYMRPCKVLGAHLKEPGCVQVGKGRITWTEQDDLERRIVESTLPAEYTCAHPSIDLILHRSREYTLLFCANPTEHVVETSIHFAGERLFQPAWEAMRGTSCRAQERLPVALDPYSVQIWEVSRD